MLRYDRPALQPPSSGSPMAPKSPKPAAADPAPTTNVAELPVARSRRTAPVVADVPVVKAGAPVKKKEFAERVAARSGLRRSDAKTALDAILAALAEALADGQELILPPLGRIKVTRDKAGKNNRVLTVRVALPKPGDAAAKGLAEADD